MSTSDRRIYQLDGRMLTRVVPAKGPLNTLICSSLGEFSKPTRRDSEVPNRHCQLQEISYSELVVITRLRNKLLTTEGNPKGCFTVIGRTTGSIPIIIGDWDALWVKRKTKEGGTSAKSALGPALELYESRERIEIGLKVDMDKDRGIEGTKLEEDGVGIGVWKVSKDYFSVGVEELKRCSSKSWGGGYEICASNDEEGSLIFNLSTFCLSFLSSSSAHYLCVLFHPFIYLFDNPGGWSSLYTK